MNENTFRAESLIRASDSASGHEKHEVLLRTVLSCPLSCTPKEARSTVRTRIRLHSPTTLTRARRHGSNVTSVELRYRRTTRQFVACYKYLKSMAFERQDGKLTCTDRFCDPRMIQRRLFRHSIPPLSRPLGSNHGLRAAS